MSPTTERDQPQLPRLLPNGLYYPRPTPPSLPLPSTHSRPCLVLFFLMDLRGELNPMCVCLVFKALEPSLTVKGVRLLLPHNLGVSDVGNV